ncbi:chorismate-binding protein [Yeosuana sp. MJ-SS3]|uniref:Chorismate-binding protein n=1 Tax=Gilvirhabdus luticola TaxID=3079858 RepID=A0ABU3U772_9FLAO|nr:chorismate-binding protein [Yeosuana sp. MJ-SS3]MDU8886235.1 chorismate-binding protein [Yeosuana sp. MJ-SS3]
MTSEDFFENLKHQFDNELPFVVYRKPNESEVKCLLQQDAALHTTKEFTESGFVFAPFDTKEEVVLIPFKNSIKYGIVMSSAVETLHNQKSLNQVKNNIEKQHHLNLVDKAIKATQSGHLLKVIASRVETVTLKDSNVIGTFKRLLNTYSTAFVYCWYHPKVGLWLGASPETLLRVEGNQFTTMALAGTLKDEGTLDVEWGNKEKDEHQLVVDFIVDKLHLFSDRIKTFKTETVRAGNILHLKTKITGIFKNNIHQIITVLHPTPAVCGQPKELAKQFILENENYNREYYTGFLGELNLKQKMSRNSNRKNVENNAYISIKNVSDLFVNLRCMQIKNNQALIYVGGGITKDSVALDEWDETVLKTLVMKKVLQ